MKARSVTRALDPAVRLSLGLVLLTTVVLLVGRGLGLAPELEWAAFGRLLGFVAVAGFVAYLALLSIALPSRRPVELTRKLEDALRSLERSRDEIRLQNQDLHFLATRDPLTGCLNRRSFFERVDAELIAGRALGRSAACVMVDIDHFKSINDRHGHAVGDDAIREVADVLRTSFRSSDALCRYGGEEFCVFFSGVDEAKAHEAAERARFNIELRRVGGVRVTASFGVAASAGRVSNSAELVKLADDALYASKAAGRNRVTCWSALERERS